MAKNPVDVFVGGRLKVRRTYVGMSQERLGQFVGLTFQQIQKYEKGANRIGASRLYQFARLLKVPPAYFFEGIEGHPGIDQVPGLAEPPAAEIEGQPMPPEPQMTRENIELLRAFETIRNTALRRRVLDLVRSMALEQGPEPAA
ncbi:helix-turn-helix transcriptional regulator [Ferrovibrio sp.]|uniref:helix-turn-helix domain-containing protein n=1 Tax=Ferrovibrio sp. TaxID=1917215 RepID=UPI0025C54A67|nr:helix-turn-helix transcriptional regulator [Ferrovibrio sp.]